MPFTPTHTLAAIPIAWIWSGAGVLPALVIGTMVPDWPLYVPFGPSYGLTHSLAGIAVACLPIGFVIAVYFQLVLKRALLELLPTGYQARLAGYATAKITSAPKLWAASAAAVALGAATHVGWDAFTHRGQWGVALLPMLNERVALTGEFSMPIYSILQHGSTFVGFPIFLLLLALWYRKAEVQTLPARILTPRARNFWIAALAIMPSVLLCKMVIDLTTAVNAREVFRTLFFGVTRSGLAILTTLLVYGIYFLIAARRAPTRSVSEA